MPNQAKPSARLVFIRALALIAVGIVAVKTLQAPLSDWAGTVAPYGIATLIDTPETRATIALAAFSPAIAAAAGDGWRTIVTAATPDDAALFAALVPLAPTKR